MSPNLNEPAATAPTQASGPLAAATEYIVDATQRSVLFWDVMRQRGNQYYEHMAEVAPHVLSYAAEVVIDGRTLERPVNYALARIIPPKGVDIHPRRRPFVVVDPRAGHGPGIGGKADSEMRAIQDGMEWPTLAEFKAMVRMLLIDPEAALAALPELLPDLSLRRKTLAAVSGVLSAAGEISGEIAGRLDRLARVLGIETRPASPAYASMSA